MSIINKEGVTKDLVVHLQDPEYCDVKIVATDGEIAANKTILGMRSPYFRSMFSSNNNFVESQTATVKLPYTKTVLEKVIIYLYSGELEFHDLDLKALLDLLELLNLINLSMEFSTVESFTLENIKKGKFSFSECLKSLDYSSKLGLKSVGETSLVFLGENFVKIAQMKEVGALSEPMIVRLLQEKGEERSQTFLRLNILTTWLSVNSMDAQVKEEVLGTLDFDHFTSKELASEVRKSGLYHCDKIIERMEQLFENKNSEFENMKTENDHLKKEKDQVKKENDQLRTDMKTVKTKVNRGIYSGTNPWYDLDAGLKYRYSSL